MSEIAAAAFCSGCVAVASELGATTRGAAGTRGDAVVAAPAVVVPLCSFVEVVVEMSLKSLASLEKASIGGKKPGESGRIALSAAPMGGAEIGPDDVEHCRLDEDE